MTYHAFESETMKLLMSGTFEQWEAFWESKDFSDDIDVIEEGPTEWVWIGIELVSFKKAECPTLEDALLKLRAYCDELMG